MVKCPRCSGDSQLAIREWEYGQFHVKLYECSGCEKSFMAYYKGEKLNHTIPKAKST